MIVGNIKKVIRFCIPGEEISKKILYRHNISNFFYKHKFNRISKYLAYKLYRKYNCWISPKAQLGKNILFPHPLGIVIGEGAIIGDNCIIYQNVTIGRKKIDIEEYPELKNGVIVYSNATIIGGITIGEESTIGCNTIVLKSVEPNSKCIGVVK